MEKFTVSRLIGAPPGYVGYEEGGQLSERVRRKPYCVVLLDEIEKAHPDIFNLLLQVMDEGRLTDSNGRLVNFKNTIVIMTSNVGSRDVQDYGSGLGFASSAKNVEADRKNVLDKAVRKAFPPEFLNRVDEMVFFNQLSKEDLADIVDIELKGLRERALEAGYKLSVSTAAKRLVADAGFDPSYGARPLRRAITKYIEDPVSEFIISDRLLPSKDGAVKTLKIGVTPDKENTVVSVKES
jgi:ATP-dependent Clp protease ATP-binding subunit ClpC